MRGKSIVTGAIILTIAGIITRILGFVYRIYMSNIIGAEGMGLYQLIMPIYSLAWSIACSGFTTTVSKLTAQENAKKEYGNVKRILKQSVFITTALGVIVGVLIFIFAYDISTIFFKDTRIVMSMKILSLAIPFMSAGSCIRGYFFGLQETVIPAINQVFEQSVRMLVIYLLAGTMIPMGLEYACAAATIGIVAEEIFSLLFVIISFKFTKARNFIKKLPTLSTYKSLALIFTMALPLTANRVIGSFLSTYENALIPQRLQLFGYSQTDALSIYGQISGMAMPLIFFPSAFLLSLSISLVPAVSEASAVKNFSRINYTTSKSLLFASVIGFASASMFVCFSKEFGQVIYNQDISRMLILLGIMCPFLYMQTVLSGILNGLGYQVFIFRNSLISSIISILFIYFLVPVKGVDAFILGWFVSLIVVCWLEIEKLRDSVSLHFEFSNWFLKPLLSAIASGLLIKYIANKLIFNNFGEVIGLISAICIFSCLYMLFIVLLGCLSIHDLNDIFKSFKKNTAK